MTAQPEGTPLHAWEGRIPPAVRPVRAIEVFSILEALHRPPVVVNEPKPVPEPYRPQPPETLINGSTPDTMLDK